MENFPVDLMPRLREMLGNRKVKVQITYRGKHFKILTLPHTYVSIYWVKRRCSTEYYKQNGSKLRPTDIDLKFQGYSMVNRFNLNDYGIRPMTEYGCTPGVKIDMKRIYRYMRYGPWFKPPEIPFPLEEVMKNRFMLERLGDWIRDIDY